jgi:ABC-type nitrate/sulfonate/bicarbonate transport system substrate-binding protein
VEGRAEFAISWITTALAAQSSKGYNITNIAQIFRRSQFGEFQWADSDVKSPNDLRGKVVCMWPGEELNLKALFNKYDIKWDDDWAFNKTTGDFDLVAQSFHVGDM